MRSLRSANRGGKQGAARGLVAAFSLARWAFLFLAAGPLRADLVVPNSGFETPSVGFGKFQYTPSGASWTFTGGAGIAANGSGFTSANPGAPEGGQVAFIQGASRFSQNLSGFAPDTLYTLRFQAAQRNYSQPGQTWSVDLDGKAIASFAPPQSATSYAEYTVAFTAAAGSHLLAFRGTLLNGGDCTVLIDQVRVTEGEVLPRAPSGLTVTALSPTSLGLSWGDNADNELGYAIERRLAGQPWSPLRDALIPASAWTDSGLAPNTTYYYRARAVNSKGGSAWSGEASQTTPLPGGPVDYQNRPFITQPAPELSFQRKSAPNPRGIDYPFSEQTARGVALLSRFPAFTNSGLRIHAMGPWYSNSAANLHFSRGISTISALPRYRLNDADPASVRKLPPNRKWDLEGDGLFWGYAAGLADDFQAQNPNDSRIASLRTFATSHVFVNDQSAFTELGRRIWSRERLPLDAGGRHVDYFSADIELTGNFDLQRNCFGWIYQGMAAAASAQGRTFIPLLYGQYQFSVNCFFDSTRQGGASTSNPPDYLLPDRDFLAGGDPTLLLCQTNAGVLSMDGYIQAIWGRDPFFKRDPDGSLVLAGGLPSFSDAPKGAAYGVRFPLETGEAKHCLDDIYRQAARMYLQWHRRAGAYPSNSALRKAFLSNTRIGAWSRYTNEGVLGIAQNDRPLPDWLMELAAGLYLFTADDLILWSSDMNYVPGPLGGDYSAVWKYNAHGVFESVVKAAHRLSACEPLHQGPFNWCWFNLPVVNQNTTPGDRYFEKPLAFGKLRRFENHSWIELFAAWPALDGAPKTFKLWVDQNGKRSDAWTFELANGRSYFYDAWQLPDTFANLEGKDIWLRSTDLLGVQRTWRGDWRAAASNTVATPPDLAPPRLSLAPADGRLALSWDQPAFALAQAAAVAGPWAFLNSNSPVSINPSAPSSFFRLQKE